MNNKNAIITTYLLCNIMSPPKRKHPILPDENDFWLASFLHAEYSQNTPRRPTPLVSSVSFFCFLLGHILYHP